MAGTSVAKNLEDIRLRIAHAAEKVGRAAADVHLVAVSKTKPVSMIDEAARAGQKIFAENYVQELLSKMEERKNLEWHFIGRVQSNKIKLLVGKAALIHSIDRSKLAAEASGFAQRNNLVQDILLQVHVGDEASKGGASLNELNKFFEEVIALKGVRVRGLMSLPPLTTQEEVARGYFSQVAGAFERIKNQITDPLLRASFNILSIGTSSDFEWAIYEGATHVRVGKAIFGERS